MNAVRVHQFGGPEVMTYENVPDPSAGPGQVLVRIHAAGVNPVDAYIRSGAYARKPALPYTPGSDAAGVVAAVGAGVQGVAPGDRVYVGGTAAGSGTYAGFALCQPTQIHPLPERVSFAQGAGVHVPYATAYQAMFFRGHARAGETVLVHGASGGVGTAAVQMARAAGLTVIGTAGSPKGLALVRQQGAHHALDHSGPDYLDAIPSLTGGRGVDVIIEMLANVNLAKDLPLLARRGRIVIVGNRGEIEINPRQLMAQDASVTGMLLFNGTEEELRAVHAAIGAGLANGTLNPVVGREFPLAEAAKAHEAVMAPGAHGKIVLTP